MPTKSLVELGRKTRERLQQELKQRREIVRLEATHLPTPPPESRKRPRLSAAKGRREDDNDDNAPEAAAKAPTAATAATTTLPLTASSCFVALHGWDPSVTTVPHVKRFLRGLHVLAVYVSVANNSDCVWVRLESPAVAALAVARSGETIRLEKDTEHAIDVTSLQVPDWEDLEPTLVVVRQTIVTIAKLREAIQSALHPAVLPLLLHQQVGQTKHPDNNSNNPSNLHGRIRIPGLQKCDLDEIRIDADNTALDDRWKRLVTLRDDLEYAVPLLDLTCPHQDPVTHLTHSALQTIQQHVTRVQQARVRVYRQKYFQAT